MKNTQSLKLNKDFKRLYSKGQSFVSAYTVIYASKNRYNKNRLGLTVSKSVGKAVVRNRIKRLMRESYRLMEDKLRTGYDIIVVSRNRAVGKSQEQIRKDIEYALRQLEITEDAKN